MCAAPLGRVFAPFWSENGYAFCPFLSGSNRVWFLRELRECMNVFSLSFQFQMSKKEREIWEFEMDLRNFFVCTLI